MKLLRNQVGYCPFMEAVVWGAPGLRSDLTAAGFALVERENARVALVRIESERDLDVVRSLRDGLPELPIVVMVSGQSAALALASVELGALGLISAEASVSEVAAALHAVASNQPFVGAGGAHILVSALRARSDARSGFALTPRERAVLAELVAGYTTPGIAERLELGVSTVQTHLKSIYRKLDVTSRAAATAIALRHQLV